MLIFLQITSIIIMLIYGFGMLADWFEATSVQTFIQAAVLYTLITIAKRIKA